MKQTSFYLPERLLQRAKIKAVRRGTTLTAILRKSLERYIHDPFPTEPEPDPEPVVSQEEMNKWIEAWNKSIAPNLCVPSITSIGSHRKRLVVARLKEHPKLWEDIYEESQYLGMWARNNAVLKFDFLMEERVLTKFLDSHYRDPDAVLVAGDGRSPLEREKELREEFEVWQKEHETNLSTVELEEERARAEERLVEWKRTRGTTDQEKSNPPQQIREEQP